ncbi:uncharacterized protein LOC100897666 [Galendromus occidentalis]|uniref:non-specific protein-tyrosine kinase n=1 Tax=Galendromus occidentalis TaxID=34638 RepID=A0AAJ6VVF2_9ACAR|nr:uncharacterized protein LOC100897666 [Galendromus occidentalis]
MALAGEHIPLTLYELLVEAKLSEYYEPFRNELQVTTADQLKLLEDRHYNQLGMSKFEQRRLKRHFDKHFSNGYLGKIRQFLMGKQLPIQDRVLGLPVPPSEPSGPQYLIPRSQIILSETLGSGEFGVVRSGVWMSPVGTRVNVAVKCLSRMRLQSNASDFLAEAAIMHSISHANIVKLYGVVQGGQDLMLVTELAPFRSLLECLKEPAFAIHSCPRILSNFAIQIAEGMAYLEGRRMIHRDLAARNVLVFARDFVKISDFGLSRALGVGKDYYQTNFSQNLKLPIAWCAPESINFLKFTSASDVWAFGVTLWEMFSFGAQPWQDFNGQQILNAIDEPNYQRLERPEACPRETYSLMLKCWAHDTSHRPTFNQLIALLNSSMPEQVQAHTDSQNASRQIRDSLEFHRGDVIVVLDKSTPEVWRGFCLGTVGYFPASATVPYESNASLVPAQSNAVPFDKGEPCRKSKPRRPQRDSSSDMTPLLRQSVTDESQTPPAAQRVAPVSLGNALPSRHEYHEISDEDLSPFDVGPPLCDEVFRGTEEPDQHAFVVAALAMSCRQRKDGSTSSTSTVMDTRPLIKNKSPGHIVKPISPTDEQAIDTAIQIAKDLASKSLQQDQSPVATPTRKHGPRFFIFNSKGHHHEKKNFSEMLEHTRQIQDALPREVTDVYSALVEKGEMTCCLEDSPPADSRTYSNCAELTDPPPPLPPKPAVKTKTEGLRHHRRIHPLVLTLPGYEQQDANNNNTFKAPANDARVVQTLPRLPAQIPPRHEPERPRSRPTSRSNESLLRSSPLHSFGSSESLPCRPEIRHFRSIEPLLETRNRPSNSTQSLRAESSRSFDRMDIGDPTGARPKKKLDRHVSCEDLLDFSTDRAAARRTQGRQRGTDSDEVHIMQKVLAYENLPSVDCLTALNITEWDVHKAIKLAKLRLLLAKRAEGAKLDEIPFSETKSVLETTNWNLEQAVQAIMGLV